MRAADRSQVLDLVVRRVVDAQGVKHGAADRGLERVIHDTYYFERKRLEAGRPTKAAKERLAWWHDLVRELKLAGETRQREIVGEITRSFAEEIVGHFDDRVYRIATKALPVGLSAMLNALSPKLVLQAFPHPPGVGDRILIEGEVETVRRLLEHGTIILAPTHLSHLDSIVLGWALEEEGLPPVTYGAGLNLFTNPFLSYFMHNLGAYKVDRKKKADLYKDTLKEYATVAMEFGYHNLFFPGGTRSRSGSVEQRLKLGLLGTGLRAYINNLRNRRPNPNLFIVPCTVSYHLVLEGETLIDDYLKEAGKNRYIIDDDESTQLGRVLSFMRNLFQLDARIHVFFGSPYDPFGNPVDDEGRSHDARGRVIDIQQYTHVNGVPTPEAQRDAEYTRLLGAQVARELLRRNTLLTTHVVAFAAFETLARRNRSLDLYRLLRAREADRLFPEAELLAALEQLQGQLQERAAGDQLRLAAAVAEDDPEAMIADALRHFGIYHTRPILERRGDLLFAADMNLLFFYHNRLWHYGLEEVHA